MLVRVTCGAAVVGGVLLLYKRRAGKVEEIPKRMRRLVLREANPDIKAATIEIEEVDTPTPRSGQVLVKIAAAPVNPSDDGVWKVPPKQGYPLALGNEGSGKVVASGGGLVASSLLGKNVAVLGKTYAEYAVVDALTSTFHVPDRLPVENACGFFINPFTVVGIVDTVRQTGGKVFIHTAAASQLGQMLVKYCQKERITLVNIVRRNEQVEVLRKLGAEYIVTTSDDDWQAKLEVLIKELKIKHAFDCIAGEMPGVILGMLPPGGRVWVYGRLSDMYISEIPPLDLIYRGKTVQGFLLTNWLFQGGKIGTTIRVRSTANKVRKYLDSVFATDFKDSSLTNLHKDYCDLKSSSATGMKMRLRP